LLDALNLQELLDRLADFLLQSGFAGRPEDQPWWAWSDPSDGDRSLDALKQASLRALLESGQLPPETLEELRGEGPGAEALREKIAELLDDIVRRLVEEGYLDLTQPPMLPDSHQPVPGAGHVDEGKEAARQVDFRLTDKGIDFLGYRTLKHLLATLGKSSYGSHDTPHLATGVEAEAASRPYEFGDALNLDIPATLT